MDPVGPSAPRIRVSLLAALLGCVSLAMALPQSNAEQSGEELPSPDRAVFQQDVEWSPDGEWLAFSEFEGGEYSPDKWAIHVVRRDGTGRRMVARDALFVSWSPDGGRLAFSSRRDGDSEIFTIGIDGNDLVQLTENETADSSPAWSPDGSRIAFGSDRDGNRELYTMAPDGSDVRRLTDNEADDYNPAWSPDGRSVVFYRTLSDEVDQILVVDADGSGERIVTPDENRNTFPAFGPDGRITFSCVEAGDGRNGLVQVAADGSDRHPIGPPGAFWGRWSPDGGTVAFIQGRWPQSAIYTMGADGTGVRKIVN